LMIMTEEKKAPAAPARKKAAQKPKKAEEKKVEAPKAHEAQKEHKPQEAPKPEARHAAPAKHEAQKAEAPKHETPKAPEAKHETVKAHEAPKHEPAKEAHAPRAPKKKKAPKKEARKVLVVRGKRKKSVARATISAGKGVVRFNSLNVASLNNHYIRDIIVEPLRYVGPEANTVDISITVRGGGVMGQAQAARTAIAHALAMYFDGMNLKQRFNEIDRSLMIEDTRRVETKKFRGPKARARFQKSYR
jgi:small subunit ribosomal protein S9